MEKPYSRPVLDARMIQQCHDIVNDLVRLHQETDPVNGSEEHKSEKAYQALNKVGMLAAMLTEWAECHIMGSYYHMAATEDWWLTSEQVNKHKHELLLYGKNLPEDFASGDEHLISNRTAIAVILHNLFSRYGAMGWRMALSESLLALNQGQTDWILRSIYTGKQGATYRIQKLKWIAIKHMYKLVGEGWKKMAAQQEVAAGCGITFEAIKKWERLLIKEMDREKEELEAIRIAAMFLKEAKENPDYTDEYVMSEALRMQVKVQSYPESDELGFYSSLSYGIIECLRLDKEHPVGNLKIQLAEAGMRQSE